MDAKIEGTVLARRLGNFRKPWARHHDRATVDHTGPVQIQKCRIGAMAHADVIDMQRNDAPSGRQPKRRAEFGHGL